MVESLEDTDVFFAPAEKGHKHITTTFPWKGARELAQTSSSKKKEDTERYFTRPLSVFEPVSLTYWASLVAQTVKRLPTMWETWVQSLGPEDLLQKETTIHSSILAWNTPWTEEPGRLQSMGSQRG